MTQSRVSHWWRHGPAQRGRRCGDPTPKVLVELLKQRLGGDYGCNGSQPRQRVPLPSRDRRALDEEIYKPSSAAPRDLPEVGSRLPCLQGSRPAPQLRLVALDGWRRRGERLQALEARGHLAHASGLRAPLCRAQARPGQQAQPAAPAPSTTRCPCVADGGRAGMNSRAHWWMRGASLTPRPWRWDPLAGAGRVKLLGWSTG